MTRDYLVSCSSIATQPADFEGVEGFNLDKSDVLFNVLTECRVVRLASPSNPQHVKPLSFLDISIDACWETSVLPALQLPSGVANRAADMLTRKQTAILCKQAAIPTA